MLITLVAGCAGPKQRAFYLPPLKLGSSIDTADGVDHREAGLIAGMYMAWYVNLCGMPDDPVLEKDISVSKLWVGYIPGYWGKLCISREAGNVVCEPRPNRVADFQMRMDRHGIVFTEAAQPAVPKAP